MSNINTDSQELSDLFFSLVKGFEKNKDGKYPGNTAYKRAVIQNARDCLTSGYSFEYLVSQIRLAKPDDAQCYDLTEYIKKKVPDFVVRKQTQAQKENECMEWGVFYYHPLLQVTSRPPAYTLNPHTMDFEMLPREPFFLEMRDSFRIEDLTAYFILRTNSEDTFQTRHHNQLRKMVQYHGLDMVLYLIEAGVIASVDEDKQMPHSPMFLMDNLEAAKMMYENRKEIAREGGLTHVYPRRRQTEETGPS